MPIEVLATDTRTLASVTAFSSSQIINLRPWAVCQKLSEVIERNVISHTCHLQRKAK